MRRNLLETWDRFWFSPTDPLPMTLFRIWIGWYCLLTGISLAPQLSFWFGKQGILSRETARLLSPPPQIRLMDLLPPGDGWVVAFWALFMLLSLFLMVGFCTRASAAGAYGMLLSMLNQNPGIFSGGEILLVIALFYLALAPSRGPTLPIWPRRMLQFQLMLMYACAAYWKLREPVWRSGAALYYVTRLDAFQGFPVPFLFDHRWSLQALTWGTIAFEACFPLLVLFKKTRVPVLLAGALFHLGMDYALNIPLFQGVTLGYYLLFVPAEQWRALAERLASQSKGRIT